MTQSEITSIFGLPIELVSAIISAVTGFMSGLLGYNYQRWLQRRGKVEARVESWRFGLGKRPEYDRESQDYSDRDVNRVGEADWASFNLEILIRNNKEIAVEVRDPKLSFSKGHNTIIEINAKGPIVPGQGIGLKKHCDMRLTVIPGAQSRILELSGTIFKSIRRANQTSSL